MGCRNEEKTEEKGEFERTVVENVMPDLLHVIPVGNDAMLDGMGDVESVSPGLDLIIHIGVLQFRADHNTGAVGTTNNCGKQDTRVF